MLDVMIRDWYVCFKCVRVIALGEVVIRDVKQLTTTVFFLELSE